jgi:hypothetical protein
LDFDPHAVAFVSQPLRLEAVDGQGHWDHTPDVFARRDDSSVWLLDVKDPCRLDRPEVRLQKARTGEVCRRLGWDYEMVVSRRDSGGRMCPGWRATGVRSTFVPNWPISSSNSPAARSASASCWAPWSSPRSPAVLFHLLWRGLLICELDGAPAARRHRRPGTGCAAVSAAYRMSIGTRVWFEDEQHDVVGFTDTATRLRSESAGMQLIATGALVADPSFRQCLPGEDEPARQAAPVDTAAMLAVLPKAERDRVTALQAHLLELTTSYRSGDPARAEPGEPRPEFELRRSVEDRVAAKAADLGVSQRSVWKYLRRWREQGLGLVDGRSKRLSNPLAGLDHRIVDAVLGPGRRRVWPVVGIPGTVPPPGAAAAGRAAR